MSGSGFHLESWDMLSGDGKVIVLRMGKESSVEYHQTLAAQTPRIFLSWVGAVHGG